MKIRPKCNLQEYFFENYRQSVSENSEKWYPVKKSTEFHGFRLQNIPLSYNWCARTGNFSAGTSSSAAGNISLFFRYSDRHFTSHCFCRHQERFRIRRRLFYCRYNIFCGIFLFIRMDSVYLRRLLGCPVPERTSDGCTDTAAFFQYSSQYPACMCQQLLLWQKAGLISCRSTASGANFSRRRLLSYLSCHSFTEPHGHSSDCCRR